MVRTRFAPSPTGHLHVGGARTALFNYLYARSRKGSFILRIEDTDQERSTEDSRVKMLRSMRWLGLDWDEGPEKGGGLGPYIQSQRLDIYKNVTENLINEGKAYRCFCTPDELEAKKKEEEAKGLNPVYDNKCRNIAPEVSHEMLSQGRPFTVRFIVNRQEVIVEDIVQGHVKFDSGIIGDFIIVKSDGFPTYNYAVVIDDHAMEISHVIRGVGHLSNTPRQILISEALGYSLPRYAHVSQIVGDDRKKLSKRHGATSLEEYERMGYLPEAFLNYLALLGWSTPDGEEFVRKEKLEKTFDIKRASKSDAIFDRQKLTWLNGKYIREYPIDTLMAILNLYINKLDNFPNDKIDIKDDHFKRVIIIMRDYFDLLGSVANVILPLYLDSSPPEDDGAKSWLMDESGKKAVKALLNYLDKSGPLSREDFFSLIKKSGKDSGVKGKALFMAVRVALSGQEKGPELPILYDLIGHEKAIKRMRENIEITG